MKDKNQNMAGLSQLSSEKSRSRLHCVKRGVPTRLGTEKQPRVTSSKRRGRMWKNETLHLHKNLCRQGDAFFDVLGLLVELFAELVDRDTSL